MKEESGGTFNSRDGRHAGNESASLALDCREQCGIETIGRNLKSTLFMRESDRIPERLSGGPNESPSEIVIRFAPQRTKSKAAGDVRGVPKLVQTPLILNTESTELVLTACSESERLREMLSEPSKVRQSLSNREFELGS